jgi:hypothetical protein
MQLFPQSLPLTQFGAFFPLAIVETVGAIGVADAGDCIGVVGAGFGFIMPENIEGFLAGVSVVIGWPFSVVSDLPLSVVIACALHDIRLCVVGSWQ